MRSIALGMGLPPVALALMLCLGCQGSTAPPDMAIDAPSADHDHADHDHGDHDHADHDDDHVKTYAEAVAKVESLEGELRESLGKGEKEKADEALHEIGHVLEHVGELAQEESFSPEQKEDVKKDVDELFEHFGTIDEQIHSDAEVGYDELSDKIHAAIERLHERAEK